MGGARPTIGGIRRISLALRVVNNRPAAEIANADIYFTKTIGLNTNLSPTRANGPALIGKRLKQQSAEYSEASGRWRGATVVARSEAPGLPEARVAWVDRVLLPTPRSGIDFSPRIHAFCLHCNTIRGASKNGPRAAVVSADSA